MGDGYAVAGEVVGDDEESPSMVTCLIGHDHKRRATLATPQKMIYPHFRIAAQSDINPHDAGNQTGRQQYPFMQERQKR
jgi:hypothetical protein